MGEAAPILTHLGSVSAEGGPLLVLDSGLLGQWRGAYGTGEDYDRACAFFDAAPELEGGLIAIGSGHGLLWDMGGAGTADIFRVRERDYIIVRIWLEAEAPDERAAVLRLAGLPLAKQTDLGLLDTPSEHCLAFWATEDASLVTSLYGANGRPEGDWGVEDCALSLPTKVARHSLSHDEQESADGRVRRLHIGHLADAIR